MVIIKKYSNRRLYDTDLSRYITLEELAERVRSGDDIRVIDAKSGRDLTQPTLAQIILESRGANKLLPTPLLARLIRMQDEDLAEFFGRYMTWALELYLQAKRGATTMAPFNPLVGLPFQATNALARMLGGVAPWKGNQTVDLAAAPPADESEDVADEDPESGESSTRAELDELRAELRALKDALGARGE